ncbi:flagellar motor protein MotB [Peribacillus deserti]|uniref:Flagellar motor protein MotB n=1 Tax=Peribacillus deserti TaxID=673318 RepID=A0A2N5MC53_9BACI|nr:flagellar motor protein MotB [Peribacillus deserti]PLT31917.1 flagellar motor protein MotB [Peribacillus deserti]
MSKRRKKHTHDEHVDESWLIPYADLLTLLLALFIVLFAMSSVDASKFKLMSQAFNEVFTGGSGVLDYPSPVLDDSSKNPERENNAVSGNDQEDKGLGDEDEKELAEIQQKVNTYMKNNKLTGRLGTKLTDEGLLVTISDKILFESGLAEIRGIDRELAGEISDLLVMNPPRGIVISGHTDNMPISTSEFDSNWDLSVMRAVNFMKILLENPKLKPQWFSAKGYGEFKPVSSNSTAAGRAANRRVEILVMPREQKESAAGQP